MVAILFVPFICIVIPIIQSLIDGDRTATWVLIWTLIFVGFVYLMVLPRSVDVRSDGTVGIKTTMMTYKFSHVVRAYQASNPMEGLGRLRIKFATDFQNRVALRRSHGKWDVFVSPVDLAEFIAAVNANANPEDNIVHEDEEAGRQAPQQNLSTH
eukprot:scaffold25087_cov201-Cylindrotheca_fusiformis.AAC.2